ncbi:hypothetical protein [Nitrosopumilus sp.]|uniref:hypothetical protein n=1 Tax=Nitrosopumilus sp. TaxID=2024843 RepID=UPI003D1410FC
MDKSENKVIAILQNDDTSAESFAKTSYFYSQKGLLPELKKHINPSRISSMDLIMAKKIIEAKRQDAIPFFHDEIFKKETKSRHVKLQCIALGSLDDKGEFTRLFLRELTDIGHKFATIQPSKYSKDELSEFLDYMYTIGNRKTSEKINSLAVEGTYIRFAVSFIAIDRDKDNFNSLTKMGSKSFHVQHVHKLIKKKILSIWILASGVDNVKYAKWLLNYFRSYQEVLKTEPIEFTHSFSKQPTLLGHIILKKGL